MHSSRAMAVTAIAIFVLAAPIAGAQTPPSGPLFVSPLGQPFRGAPDSQSAPILLWLAQADADADTKLSREEFVSDAMSFFTTILDANHDGGATSLESTELWRTQAPEMLSRRTAQPRAAAATAQRGAPRGARGGAMISVDRGERRPTAGAGIDGPPQEVRAQIMLGDEVEPVMSCDRDFSRRIDAAEFRACAERRFAALDINHDGYFALDESERAQEMLGMQ